MSVSWSGCRSCTAHHTLALRLSWPRLNGAWLGLANAPGAALVVGLRCNGAGSPTAWNELEAMLARCQKDRVGVAVWYLVCLTDTYKEKNFTLGNTPLNQT